MLDHSHLKVYPNKKTSIFWIPLSFVVVWGGIVLDSIVF